MTRLNVCVMWWCLVPRQYPIMYAYPAFQILDMLCKYYMVFIQRLFCMIWWARVLVWFKRKQWWKGCFAHRLVPDHIHLILSVHVSYLNWHHHWQILVNQCFEIFSMGFSFWFCGCAAAGYSWLQVCSAIQFASKCETAANLVPELAAGIQQCMDH